MLEVHEVTSARGHRQFVRFPYQIYRHNPAWIAPLELERLELLDRRKHPFYKHGDAAAFVATRNSEIVGRILVSDDPIFNATQGTNLGAFGMFESQDDAAIAAALFDKAETWLIARGRDTIRGPYDFSLNYQAGLLIDGFDTPPRIMMNYNPPYYQLLVEACGFAKIKDLYAYWFDDSRDMLSRWRRRAERAARQNVIIRSPKRSEMQTEFMRCAPLFNDAWAKNWGASPMTDEEFRFFGKTLGQIAVPELLLVAEVAGEPVGFSMTLPDINEALRPVGGRLTRWGLPIGLVRLLVGMKRIKTARLVALGILEKYRRRGIAELLILRTLDYGKNVLHYTGAELSWTLEDNKVINHTIEAVGGVHYKTYRLYEKKLTGANQVTSAVAVL